MGAPAGNQNALGNRGGGRKSAHQESLSAELWMRTFIEPMDVEKLKQRLDGGVYSIFDAMLYLALRGNDKVILTMYRKLVPENMTRPQANKLQRKAEKIQETLRKILQMKKPGLCVKCQAELKTRVS